MLPVQYAVHGLCNGRVDCPSVRPAVPPTAAAFRSIPAAGARVQQRAGSINAVIPEGSAPIDFVLGFWFSWG